jgi:predicted DNA binding CopG/RHH family protein
MLATGGKENENMKKINYTDDKGDYGPQGRSLTVKEITALGIPAPEQLAAQLEQTVKITVELESKSLAFLKAKAKECRVPYQRMLRELVKSYAEAAS